MTLFSSGSNPEKEKWDGARLVTPLPPNLPTSITRAQDTVHGRQGALYFRRIPSLSHPTENTTFAPPLIRQHLRRYSQPLLSKVLSEVNLEILVPFLRTEVRMRHHGSPQQSKAKTPRPCGGKTALRQELRRTSSYARSCRYQRYCFCQSQSTFRPSNTPPDIKSPSTDYAIHPTQHVGT